LEALAHFLNLPPASLWDDSVAQDVRAPEEALPLAQMLLLRRKILAVEFRQLRLAAGLSQQAMGKLLNRSAYMISQYERAQQDIPMAELEIAAHQCGRSLAEFLDDQTIPLAQAVQDRQTLSRLNELPDDVRDFVLNPTNALYLRIAMLLSTLKADNLRQIAELILEITY
jgi:transcriptional regulator with XRE-family HTH domain